MARCKKPFEASALLAAVKPLAEAAAADRAAQTRARAARVADPVRQARRPRRSSP